MKALSIAGIVLLALILIASAAPAEGQRVQHRVEKKVVVINGDHDGSALADLGIDEDDLECTEENGHKVCVAHKVMTSETGGGHFSRGYLGVHLTPMTPELREHFGAPIDSGVLISKIEDDSPAATAGFEVGDVITAVDGDAISSARDLVKAIGSREDGDLATLEIYREGRLHQITATLDEREAHRMRSDFRIRLHDGEHADLFEHLHESLGDIDFTAIGAEIHEGLSGVQWEEISARIHEALQGARAHEEQH